MSLVNNGNYCLADPGKTYAIYLPKGGEVTVQLAPGHYRAFWFSAVTGEQIDLPPVDGSFLDLAGSAGRQRLGHPFASTIAEFALRDDYPKYPHFCIFPCVIQAGTSNGKRDGGLNIRITGLSNSDVSIIFEGMEVHFTPETEKKLKDLAAQSGRGTADELVQDVVEGYFAEVTQTRQMPQQPL